MKTRWVHSSVIARIYECTQRTVRNHCRPGRCLHRIHIRTEGGHIRIDLESARRIATKFKNRKDRLAIQEEFE